MSLMYWRAVDNPDMIGCVSGTFVSVPMGGDTFETRLVPSIPDDDWWSEEHLNGGPYSGDPAWEFTRENDAVAKVVRFTWSPRERTIEEARRDKYAEIEARYRQAFDLGVPATVTVGTTDHQIMCRLTEQDATRYAFIEPDAIPPVGVAIFLTEAVSLNGTPRIRHMEKNVDRYTSVRVACQGHLSQADDARFQAENDTADAATIEAVDAIDVNSYSWPPNTHLP